MFLLATSEINSYDVCYQTMEVINTSISYIDRFHQLAAIYSLFKLKHILYEPFCDGFPRWTGSAQHRSRRGSVAKRHYLFMF